MKLTPEISREISNKYACKANKLEDEIYDEYKKGNMPRLEYISKTRQSHAEVGKERLAEYKKYDGEEAERAIDAMIAYIEREESIAKRTLEELEQKKKNGEKIDYFIYFI